MKRLLFISLFSLLLFSCRSYHGPVTSKENYTQGTFTVVNPYFATIGEEHIFRAHISIFKKELSGLLVVKRMDEQVHRVVLTSDFGNTLFDFSIYKDNPYAINYVMPDLDKKILLNFLAKDFGYLVEDTYALVAKATQGDTTVYKGLYKKQKTFVVVNQQEDVMEVIAASARKPKISFTYAKAGEMVEIKHQNFPLSIQLTPLENNEIPHE
ncbi:hypothetical protein ACPDHL_04950 [Myroides sp. C15-4]|uniref:hypothetical protein n=1 Tax=Myroides sp. C15-4 TaxID=3400532 RepID=UPI003D2F6844